MKVTLIFLMAFVAGLAVLFLAWPFIALEGSAMAWRVLAEAAWLFLLLLAMAGLTGGKR